MLVDVRVGAYGVIVQGSRVLLAHWNEDGRTGWTLPGGGLEPGESPAQAARREIREETGFSAELDAVLGVDSYILPGPQRLVTASGPLQYLRIVYRARITGGTLSNELNGSTDRAEWFDLAEVAGLPRVDLVDVGLRYLQLP